MRYHVAAGILAVSVLGGVGAGVVAHAVDPQDVSTAGPRPTPGSEPTSTVTPTSTGAPPADTSSPSSEDRSPPSPLPTVPVASLRIIPGAIGPVSVGMSKRAAYGTDYFDADVRVPSCDRIDDLQWKPGYEGTLDVLTREDGHVQSLGVLKRGPETRSGIGIGTTYETVQGVLGDVPVHEAGYGQTGLFVHKGDRWIGFLFDAPPDAVAKDSPVTFIEVTRGSKPGLRRDGC